LRSAGAVTADADVGAFDCADGVGSDFEHAAAIETITTRKVNRLGHVTSLMGVA
jgi:hypothetical protein